MKNSLKLLTDYLQDILERPDTASLNLNLLSPDFLELGKAMTFLADKINRLSNQLQKKADFVEMENQVLMDNIQAMNEISWSLEQSNQELRNNLALVNALTDYTHNMIFVYSVDTGQEVHTNQPANWFRKAHAQTAGQLIEKLLNKQPEIQQQMEQQMEQQLKQRGGNPESEQEEKSPADEYPGTYQGESPDEYGETYLQGDQPTENQDADRHQTSLTWNMEVNGPDGADTFYQVESFLIPWFNSDDDSSQGAKKQAIVHIVMDETERQRRQNLIYRFAYVDPLTRLNNRRYAIEKMEQWLKEGTPFALSFIDVDYLKYCNDTFGHERGDSYLIEVAEALQTMGGEVCRVGGDEFFLLQTDITPADQDQKLEKLRQMMLTDKSDGHPKCFSYATNLIPAYPDAPLEMYISDTDTKMYQYKQKYKIPLSDAVYKDERI